MPTWDRRTFGPRPEPPGVRKYASTQIVPIQRTRDFHRHLLEIEAKTIGEVVKKVHEDGYEGVEWPQVTRTPLRRVTVSHHGEVTTTWREVHPNDLYPPEVYEIRARVKAVPRDGR